MCVHQGWQVNFKPDVVFDVQTGKETNDPSEGKWLQPLINNSESIYSLEYFFTQRSIQLSAIFAPYIIIIWRPLWSSGLYTGFIMAICEGTSLAIVLTREVWSLVGLMEELTFVYCLGLWICDTIVVSDFHITSALAALGSEQRVRCCVMFIFIVITRFPSG